MLSVIACLVPLTVLGAGENLLGNLTLESGVEGWVLAEGNSRIEAGQIDGLSVATITVPPDAKPGWPSLYREFAAAPGDLLVAQVRVRTEDVGGGHGAYIAIEFNDTGDERITYAQSEGLKGTGGWTELRIRSVAPPDTARARFVCLLNGHGRAHFTAARVENAGSMATGPLDGPVTLTVTDDVVCEEFLGFGFEDDGWFYNDENAAHGVTEEDYALKERRVEWMDPDRVRMFFWIKDYCPSGNWETFDFDSVNMRSHYRTLDLYQRIGADVNVTGVEWGFDRPYDDVPRAAKGIATLVEHLVRDRGYTCVKSWTLTNEPNGSWVPRGDTFEHFAELTRLVRKEFSRRKLDVQVVGSDDTSGLAWFTRCVEDDDYFHAADYFASHLYQPFPDRVLSPFFFKDRLELLAKRQPRKPFTVEEFGFQDQRSDALNNPIMMTYPYAVWAAAFCIEGLNLGVAGFSIWASHEVYYPGNGFMEYALWEFKDDGWKVRPVYHAWANFCRLTDKGDPVRRCESSSPNHVIAARVGDTLFWVNRADVPAEVRIEGMPAKEVRIHTESTLEGDRETGTLQALQEPLFTAPPQSFGYVR